MQRSRVAQYAVALLAVASVAALRALLAPHIGGAALLSSFVIAVAGAAWYGGARPALLAAALGYLVINVYFTEPIGQVSALTRADVVALFLYVLACAAIVGLAGAMRAAATRAESSRHQALHSEERLASQLARMQRLQQVSAQLVRSTELAAPLEDILAAAVELTGADAGDIELLQDDRLQRSARYGVLPGDRSAADRATLTGAPVVIEDTALSELLSEENRAALLEAGVEGVQSMPLTSRSGRLLGTMTTYYRASRKPDRGDIDVIDWLASKASDFIDRVQAERALQQSEERHRFLVELGGVLNEHTHPDELMEAAMRFVAQRFGVSRCRFDAVDPESDRLTVEWQYHSADEPLPRELSISQHGPEFAADGLAGRVHVIDDMALDPRTASCYPAHLAPLGIRSAINVPLLHGRRWLANFSVVHREPRSWAEAEIALLRATADRVWLALENTRLFSAMRDAAARLKAIVDTAVDGIITIDEHGVIESANPAVERIFGYPVQDVLGRNVSMLMPEPYRSEHDGYPTRYLGTGNPNNIGAGREVSGRRRDGSEFPLDLAVSETHLDGRRIFTGIVRDITDRKAAQDALQEADQRKDQFLALLAHELRNPLAPLRNAVEILQRSKTQEQIEWSRRVVERQVSHLTRLIDDLLDVSRITRDKLEIRTQRIDLADAVQAALETSRPLLERSGHELTVSLPEEPIYLDGDIIRLAQVFTNLLSNAAKFTPPRGAIKLIVEHRGQEAVLRFVDTGIGIAAEELPQIFDMFFQTSRDGHAQSGLGIGLSLVRRLVQLHNGTVEAHSAGPGRGSEFVVRLPTLGAALPLQPVEGPEEQVERTRRGACRILVVDDNTDSADSLARLLQLTGHEARTAYHGLEALATAEKYRPNVMLLDLGMPEVDGYDVCRRLRERGWGREIFLVALTGWGRDEDRLRTQRAGFDAHLVKPVDRAALDALLRLSERVTTGRSLRAAEPS